MVTIRAAILVVITLKVATVASFIKIPASSISTVKREHGDVRHWSTPIPRYRAGVHTATTFEAAEAVAYAFSPPSESLDALGAWASSCGVTGLVVYVALHAIAVIGCFPATVLFELTAGLTFGLGRGVLAVWIAKLSAASVTFAIARGPGRPLADGVADRAAAAATAVVTARPALATLGERVGEDGLRFTLLARLSAAPSWVSNYGLALAFPQLKVGPGLGPSA